MDFGIFMDFYCTRGLSQNEVFQEAFDLADMADAAGLDTVWLGESHFNPNRSVLSAPIVVAGSIAARTKRLRVGMAVQVLPLISPLRIAEESATVDQISQGRFEFGVGRSGNQRAYEIMGIPYEESPARFQEALDIIMQAWKERPSPTTVSSTISRARFYHLPLTRNLTRQSGWRPRPRRASSEWDG